MRRLLVVVLFAFLLLAGCKVDTTVTLAVHDDGSGFVGSRSRSTPRRCRTRRPGEAGSRTASASAISKARVGGVGVEAGTGWQRHAVAAQGRSLTPATSGHLRRDQRQGRTVAGVALERDHNVLFSGTSSRASPISRSCRPAWPQIPRSPRELTGQRVDLGQVDQQLTQEIRDAFRLRVRLSELPHGSKELTPEPGEGEPRDVVDEFDTSRAACSVLAAVVLGVIGLVVFVCGARFAQSAPEHGASAASGQ